MNAATAFDDACKNGDAALAASLVQEGSIGMDCVLDAVREALRTERTELIQALAPHLPHYPTTMHKVACWAAERGDLQTVSLLMQNGGEDLNGSSRVMETAATHGHYDCLVALGVLRKKEALDWAFRAACRADQLDVVVELIQAPKEKRQYAVTQILLREGLEAACQGGAMKVVGYLVQDQELARRTVKLMGKQAPDKQDPNAIALLQSVLEQRELAGTTELSARSSRRAQRL